MNTTAYVTKWACENGCKVVGGKVLSPHTSEPLAEWTNRDGYKIVSIYIPKELQDRLGTKRRQASVRVHRIIAYHKYGNIVFRDGMQVRHLDGNPANNSWDNIAVGTQSQNMMDRPKKERVRHAKRAARAIRAFTDEEVTELRKILPYYPSPKVAEIYGVSKSTISYIENRITYRDVP